MDVRMGRFYSWQLRHVPDERSGDEEDWSPQSLCLYCACSLHVQESAEIAEQTDEVDFLLYRLKGGIL